MYIYNVYLCVYLYMYVDFLKLCINHWDKKQATHKNIKFVCESKLKIQCVRPSYEGIDALYKAGKLPRGPTRQWVKFAVNLLQCLIKKCIKMP